MADGPVPVEQWLALVEQQMTERQAIRDQIARAEKNLLYTVECVLGDLGDIGEARGRDIMADVASELECVLDLIGGDDE